MRLINFFKKYTSIIFILTLLGFSLWSSRGLFTYKFWSTHDGNHHLARSFDAIETIKEGHFPLRWAGTLNWGCGVPVYNFFYPLIYYLVILFNLGLSDIYLSYKLVNLLSLILGTLFFYLWMKEETKDSLASFTGSLLYLFAPYRFLLIYVRGSPEYLAYGILPVVLYCFSKLINSNNLKHKYLFAFLASTIGSLLIISHNFTVMFLVPIILIFLSIKLFIGKVDLKSRILTTLSFLGSILISSFFWGPLLLEKKYVKLGLTNTIDFKDHFPSIMQLIRSKWDYFYSGPGVEADGMSFMLGYAQWLIMGVVFVWLLILVFKNKRNIKNFAIKNIELLLFFSLSLIFIFLTLPVSTFAWKILPFLKDIQFPWRLIGLSVFTISATLVYFLVKIKSKILKTSLVMIFCLLAIYGNRNHLLPMPIADNDFAKFEDFTRLHDHRYSTTTFGDDILSKDSKLACGRSTPAVASTDSKDLTYNLIEKGSTFGSVSYIYSGYLDEQDKIILALEHFPKAYEIKLNGEKIEYFSCEGRVCLNLDKHKDGINFVSWKIVQTPVQKIFNFISFLTLLAWVAILFLKVTGIGINLSKKQIPKYLILFGIFITFCFFRFYNLSSHLGFAWDLERDAFAVKEILTGNLTLIGPRVIGPEGFFLPPYFFYLLTPFYALTGGSPNALLIFIYAYSVTFFALGFKILSKLFSEKIAFVFLILWAINPFSVGFDTTPWNPILIPLFFLLLIYFLFEYFKYDKIKYLIYSSLVFGLGLSFHFQFIFYLPLFIPFIFVGKNIRSVIKKLIYLGSMVALIFIPVIVFDFRHGFLNLKAFLVTFSINKGLLNLDFTRVMNNVFESILNTHLNIFFTITIYLALVITGFYLYKNNKEKQTFSKKLMLGFLFTLISPAIFIFYKGEISEYYLFYLSPVIFLILVSIWDKIFFSKDKYKAIGIVLLTFALFIPFIKSFKLSTTEGVKSYLDKKEVVEFISIITKERSGYNISYSVPVGEDSGFRYLIDYYQIKPSGIASDTLIQITYPNDNRKDDFSVNVYGVRVPKSWLIESNK